MVDCAPQVAAALTDPETVLDRAERDALTRTSGYFPLGLPDLRAAIASHLTERAGLPAEPSQVLVTTGGQQALDLLIRSEVLPASRWPWRTRRSPAYWTRCTGRAPG